MFHVPGGLTETQSIGARDSIVGRLELKSRMTKTHAAMIRFFQAHSPASASYYNVFNLVIE